MLCYLFAAKDYEIAVENLQLEEIIGQGQFGDVYKGTYRPPVCLTFCLFFISYTFLTSNLVV